MSLWYQSVNVSQRAIHQDEFRSGREIQDGGAQSVTPGVSAEVGHTERKSLRHTPVCSVMIVSVIKSIDIV